MHKTAEGKTRVYREASRILETPLLPAETELVNCLFRVVIRIVKDRHLPGYRGSEMGLVFSSVRAVSLAGLRQPGQPCAVVVDE